MKTIRFLRAAQSDMKRHGNMAGRIKRALEEYAANPAAHANNVIKMVGSDACRMRVANFRVIFDETEAEIVVTKIAPRGNVYD